MHWTLQNTLWSATGLLESFTTLVMFLRGTWREYRVFWSYLVAECLRTALLFAIGNGPAHYEAYFFSYWISEAFVCLLGFFVIREIFGKAFCTQLGLKRWGDRIFVCSLMGLLAVASLSAASHHGTDSSRLLAAILVLKWAESFVRLGVLAALSASVLVLGLPWKHHAVGVAAGFAFYGSIELAMLAARLRLGREMNRYVVWMFMSAGFVENVIWGLYFLPVSKRKAAEIQESNPEIVASTLVTARKAVKEIWER